MADVIVINTETLPDGRQLYRDRDNPNCGWIVEQRRDEQGRRYIHPLDYIRRPRG